MTIHVNIGEAKTRLSELLRAMKRGERVVIMRAGEPDAELVPPRHAKTTSRSDLQRKRQSAFGIFKQSFEDFNVAEGDLKTARGDPDERFGRKFGADS